MFYGGPESVSGIGLLVLVCPDLALYGQEENVIYQSMAVSNWQGPLFILGSVTARKDLAHHQRDYVEAIHTVCQERRCYQYQCENTIPELSAAAKVLSRHVEYTKKANSRLTAVTGAWKEAHVFVVARILAEVGYQVTSSLSAITFLEMGVDRPDGTESADVRLENKPVIRNANGCVQPVHYAKLVEDTDDVGIHRMRG